MKIPMLGSFVLTGLLLVASSSARAAVTNWTIQSSSSTLALSGAVSVGGSFLVSLTSQPPGNGLSTTYQGQISTDLSSSSIELLNASMTANNSGSFAPTWPSHINTSPANYGALADLGFIGQFNIAFRDLVFDLNSAALGLTGTFGPNGSQSFLGDIDAETISGALEFGTTGPSIPESSILSFVGQMDTFQSAGTIDYSGDFGTATMTIPMFFQFTEIGAGADTTSTADDITATFLFSGQIVATAAVPEASSLVLLGLAGSVVGFAGYRKARR